MHLFHKWIYVKSTSTTVFKIFLAEWQRLNQRMAPESEFKLFAWRHSVIGDNLANRVCVICGKCDDRIEKTRIKINRMIQDEMENRNNSLYEDSLAEKIWEECNGLLRNDKMGP